MAGACVCSCGLAAMQVLCPGAEPGTSVVDDLLEATLSLGDDGELATPLTALLVLLVVSVAATPSKHLSPLRGTHVKFHSTTGLKQVVVVQVAHRMQNDLLLLHMAWRTAQLLLLSVQQAQVMSARDCSSAITRTQRRVQKLLGIRMTVTRHMPFEVYKVYERNPLNVAVSVPVLEPFVAC